jgi:hypothetical protein
MKFPKEDFPLIRTAVILLASTILLAAAAIAGSIYLKDVMRKSLNADRKQLVDVQNRFAQLNQEKEEIHLYHTRYEELIRQGVTDKENRLAWIENLAATKERHQIFELDYQISPRQPVQPDPALLQGSLALYGSSMKLGFSLLHEGDLFNALDDIRRSNRGLSLLRECILTRTAPADTPPVRPRLQAECTLLWLSLSPRNGEEEKP